MINNHFIAFFIKVNLVLHQSYLKGHSHYHFLLLKKFQNTKSAQLWIKLHTYLLNNWLKKLVVGRIASKSITFSKHLNFMNQSFKTNTILIPFISHATAGQ